MIQSEHKQSIVIDSIYIVDLVVSHGMNGFSYHFTWKTEQ